MGTNLVTSTGEVELEALRSERLLSTEAAFRVHFYFLFLLLEPCHFK